ERDRAARAAPLPAVRGARPVEGSVGRHRARCVLADAARQPRRIRRLAARSPGGAACRRMMPGQSSAAVGDQAEAAPARTLVVLQPGYLPWLGFFDQMRRSDVFVYYDDGQFDKHGWRNRNRIKSPAGPLWLSVPVLHHGRGQPRIVDAEIDTRTAWARKHIG